MIIGLWKTTPCKVAELILDASVFPVATRTPSTVGTEALRIERGAPFGSGSRCGPGSLKSVVIAHLRMLSNTHWVRIELNLEHSPMAKQHPKELKREPTSPPPLDKIVARDDAAFSRTTAFSPITATHGDDPHGSSRILYRQLHAALKNGWLHRAHHQQAELQSKQATPILGEMIHRRLCARRRCRRRAIPGEERGGSDRVSRSKSGGGPAKASAEADWSAKQGPIHALVEAISPPLDCTDTIDLPRKSNRSKSHRSGEIPQ